MPGFLNRGGGYKNAEHLKNEKGITAIEYAIIGVAMASGLFFIFNDGGFMEVLRYAWMRMSMSISEAGNILH
ncbi:Flp family type IVb pilin [Enterobacteriaceae bacterium 4M9]|nr:Flp family type IVb pilin [Enterobacteriaceae bacterium 4M9]